VQVVSEPTPWKGGLAGVNSFGFGGANAHGLLRSHDCPKPDKDAAEVDGQPRLIITSGRTEEAVETILTEVSFFYFLMRIELNKISKISV
jgi:fatty acid synthase, animal type